MHQVARKAQQTSAVTLHHEIDTLTSSMTETSQRISALVEGGKDLTGDVYVELVAIERTVGTLVRRLERLGSRLS
jgi:plasmid maintenance system antidote protein VapI